MSRIFIIFGLGILLSACGSTHKSQYNSIPKANDVNGMYNYANNLLCSRRHNGNQKYCDCWVGVMDDITPESTKLLISKGGNEAISEQVRLMTANTDKLSACNSLMTYNFEIRDEPHSQVLLNILEKYHDDILSPSDIDLIDMSDIKEGFEYRTQNLTPNSDGTLDLPHRYKFSKTVDNAAYFSPLDENGVIQNQDVDYVMWKNGVMHVRSEGNVYRARGYDSKCQFVLGLCTYETYGERIEANKMLFKSGVWISSQPGSGSSRRLVKEVYDKNGMLLYQLNKNKYGQWEKVRVELN